MKTMTLLLLIAGSLLAAAPAPAAPAPPFAVLDTCAGEVALGAAGGEAVWSAAKPKMAVTDAQIIRTGAKSQATVRFTEGDLVGLVGENTTISLQDLLLKTRLDKMRNKISEPAADAQPSKASVTPLTGVRGTDEAEGKAEDPNRQHHWEENAPSK
jgi:hypothetical protein